MECTIRMLMELFKANGRMERQMDTELAKIFLGISILGSI
jgi:hypothetical protein